MNCWRACFFLCVHEKPALAKTNGAAHAPTAATTNKPASATRPPEAEAADTIGNSMSTLSTKVNSDRARGGVSRSVYIGYLKACGTVVVSVALAISVFAQVRNTEILSCVENFAGFSCPSRVCKNLRGTGFEFWPIVKC